MDSVLSAHLSRRLMAATNRPQHYSIIKRSIPRHLTISPTSTLARHASSSSSSSSRPPPSSSKPIILEPPDKFRPPSHPARLNTRKTTATYGGFQGGGAYNQDATAKEKEQQAKNSYPNMFPKEGSFMHWFLTNRVVHLWISLGTLTLLALTTLSQNFIQTSPFAHLLPSPSSFLSHPFRSTKEFYDVFRLHVDYESEKTALARQDRILDAQKRRVYRRAHGMEDMEAQESQGIDITGIVDWDDGLTNRERERGGRTVFELAERGKRAFQKSVEVAGLEDVIAEREREMEIGRGNGNRDGEGDEGQELQQPQPQKKKVKRWLGIWE